MINFLQSSIKISYDQTDAADRALGFVVWSDVGCRNRSSPITSWTDRILTIAAPRLELRED